jgi:hypothetical protein
VAASRSQFILSGLFVLAYLAIASNVVADTYRINIGTDVEKGHADGKMTLRYQNLGEQPLLKLRLRLDVNLAPNSRMTISSVRDSNGKEFTWRYLPFKFGKLNSERGQLEIDLAEPLDANRDVEIQVAYLQDHAGTLNREMITFQDDPYHSFDAWYPKAMTYKGNEWSLNDDRLS